MKKYIMSLLVIQDVYALSSRNFGNSNSSSRSVSPDRVLTPRTELRMMKEERNQWKKAYEEEKEERKKEKEENEQNKKNSLIFNKRTIEAYKAKENIDILSKGLQEIRNKTEEIMMHNEELAIKNTSYKLRGVAQFAECAGAVIAIIGVIGLGSLCVASGGSLGFLIAIAKTFSLVSFWPSLGTLAGGLLCGYIGMKGEESCNYYLNVTESDREKLKILFREFDSAAKELSSISIEIGKFIEIEYDAKIKYDESKETHNFYKMIESATLCCAKMEGSKEKVGKFMESLLITEEKWAELNRKDS